MMTSTRGTLATVKQAAFCAVCAALLVLPTFVGAVGNQADLSAAGSGGCDPGSKYDAAIPYPQRDQQGKIGLIGMSCTDTTGGHTTPGTCIAANKCEATSPMGKATEQQIQQANNGNTAGGTPQTTAGSGAPASAAGTTNANTSAQAQVTSATPLSAYPSTNAFSPTPTNSPVSPQSAFTSNNSILDNALQTEIAPQSQNSAAQNGSDVGYAPSASVGQASGDPMGSLQGLDTQDVQTANYNNTLSPGQQNALTQDSLENAAQNGSPEAQAILQYQAGGSTFGGMSQTQQFSGDTTDMRATIYTPGTGGSNGGLYGTHDNYLDPSVPEVAAGYGSGLQYGDVVNVANPSTGLSVNAVVGDACPACGSGIDLNPIAAQNVGLTMNQGVGQMQVGLIDSTGNYASGSQLASSLNSPSDPWANASSGYVSDVNFTPPQSLAPQGSVEDFPSFASSQLSQDGAFPQEAPEVAANVPLPQPNPIASGPDITLQDTQSASLQPVDEPSSGLSGGTSGDANSIVSQPIPNEPVQDLAAAPVTPVTSAELPEPSTPYPVVSVETGPSLSQPNPVGQVETGPELSAPNPVTSVEAGPSLAQPYPIASVESSDLAPIQTVDSQVPIPEPVTTDIPSQAAMQAELLREQGQGFSQQNANAFYDTVQGTPSQYVTSGDYLLSGTQISNAGALTPQSIAAAFAQPNPVTSNDVFGASPFAQQGNFSPSYFVDANVALSAQFNEAASLPSSPLTSVTSEPLPETTPVEVANATAQANPFAAPWIDPQQNDTAPWPDTVSQQAAQNGSAAQQVAAAQEEANVPLPTPRPTIASAYDPLTAPWVDPQQNDTAPWPDQTAAPAQTATQEADVPLPTSRPSAAIDEQAAQEQASNVPLPTSRPTEAIAQQETQDQAANVPLPTSRPTAAIDAQEQANVPLPTSRPTAAIDQQQAQEQAPNVPLPIARPSLPSNPSIVDFLNTAGQDASFEARAALAAANGIAHYIGSAAQNLKLLKLCFAQSCSSN